MLHSGQPERSESTSVDHEGSDGSNDELIEIERASAILHQRDPEQAEQVIHELRSRKKQQQRREQKAHAIRVARAEQKRIRHRRIGIIVGMLALAGIASIFVAQGIAREADRAQSLQAALTRAGEPITAVGFTLAEEWLNVPPAGVVFDIPRNTCSVVLGVAEGSDKPLPVAVSREGTDALQSDGGVVWCSCDQEQVTASFQDASDKRLALRYLTAKMGRVGGIEVLSGLERPGFSIEQDDRAYGCADAAFSTWAKTAGSGSLDQIGDSHLRKVATFREEKFTALGVFSEMKRFAVIPSRKDHCYLALPVGKKAPITLRNTHGRRVVKASFRSMGWCTYTKERAYSLWRKEVGDPEMLVLEVPAQRVGGLTGLKQSALRHGIRNLASTMESKDLAPDATAALLASGVGQNTITVAQNAGLPGKINSRVVSFALFKTSSFLPEVTPRIPLACDPNPDPTASFQTYVCVQARPQKWRREGSPDTQGAAEGRLPFWALLLAESNSVDALKAVARMLAFSRRMTLLGFEPTTSDGVKDTASGCEVLGRPNKSEVVAVGLSKRAPWVHPLTKGSAWTLTGALPIVKVKPDESVRLRSRTGSLGRDPNARRVVVWRR